MASSEDRGAEYVLCLVTIHTYFVSYQYKYLVEPIATTVCILAETRKGYNAFTVLIINSKRRSSYFLYRVLEVRVEFFGLLIQ